MPIYVIPYSLLERLYGTVPEPCHGWHGWMDIEDTRVSTTKQCAPAAPLRPLPWCPTRPSEPGRCSVCTSIVDRQFAACPQTRQHRRDTPNNINISMRKKCNTFVACKNACMQGPRQRDGATTLRMRVRMQSNRTRADSPAARKGRVRQHEQEHHPAHVKKHAFGCTSWTSSTRRYMGLGAWLGRGGWIGQQTGTIQPYGCTE